MTMKREVLLMLIIMFNKLLIIIVIVFLSGEYSKILRRNCLNFVSMPLRLYASEILRAKIP